VLAPLQTQVLGLTILDRLVLAILLGALVRSLWMVPPSVEPGITFAATPLLEVAIVLLGAAVDLPLLLRAGAALALGIIVLVVVGLGGHDSPRSSPPATPSAATPPSPRSPR
jgi:uncharacterized membrane protein YadS